MVGLLAVIYIVFISLGLPDSLFGVAWPVMHVEFGVFERFASFYSIIIGLCTGGVSFFSGRLIRKFGTGRVTFVSTLLTVIGMVGMSFAPNLLVLMVFAVVMGYGAGAIDTGLNNFVSLHYEARHMNWLHCFWGVGVTLSPMIMSVFLKEDNGGWRDGYRVVALLQFLIALLVLVTLKKWRVEQQPPQEETVVTEKKGLFAILRTAGVVPSIFSLGLYCAGEFMVGTWGATYAVNAFAASPDAAARWVSLYYGGIMLGRMAAGFASVKLSDGKLIRLGMAIAAVGMVLLVLPLGTVSLCGLLLVGFGYGPVFPCVLHSIPARFGSAYSADITGYHMGGAYAIGFAVQLAYGYVASATSFFITPFVLGGLCISVLIANRLAERKCS